MSAENDEIDVEVVDTMTGEEAKEFLSQPVTLSFDTTLYGYVTLIAGLGDKSHEQAVGGHLDTAMEVLRLATQIDDQNPETVSLYEDIEPYLLEDRVSSQYEGTALCVPEDE